MDKLRQALRGLILTRDKDKIRVVGNMTDEQRDLILKHRDILFWQVTVEAIQQLEPLPDCKPMSNLHEWPQSELDRYLSDLQRSKKKL